MISGRSRFLKVSSSSLSSVIRVPADAARVCRVAFNRYGWRQVELRMSKRTLSTLAALSTLLWLAGCGDSGFKKVAAPNQENVLLVRAEFSSEGESSGPKANPLEGRTEAAWASLHVTVKLDGSKPSPVALQVTKDLTVCKPDGSPVYGNLIQVGDNGALGNVLLYLDTDLPVDDSDEEQPIWVHSRYSLQKNPELATVLFDQKECLFLSPVFAMRTDQTLDIKNSDPVGHNTKLDTTKAKPLNDNVPAGQSITYEPGAEERQPFGVSCSVHPWMKAFMITRGNPYFGVSDAKMNGEFTIADIPAGVELEYRVWIPEGFADPGSTTLTLDGSAVEIKRGGKVKLLLTPGVTHKLKLMVNSSALGG